MRSLQRRLPMSATLADRIRFRSRATPSGCIEYVGSRNSDGYGTIRGAEGTVLAHRAAYASAYGEIPEGLYVLHSCDNPPCVNPAHLRASTQRANVSDSIARERFARGERHSTCKLTDDECDSIRAMHREGASIAAIAAQFPQVKPGHVYRVAVGTRRSIRTDGTVVTGRGSRGTATRS